VVRCVVRSVSAVLLTAAGGKLHLEDFAALLHDALLLSKPTFIGHPLGEVGVLNFPLGASLFGAGNAGCDFEQAHGFPEGEGGLI
jgi:hypothetical protein